MASSSSEDSLLELLELLLLLIVASERGRRAMVVGTGVPGPWRAARAALRACVGRGSVGLEDGLPFSGRRWLPDATPAACNANY